VNKLGSLPLSIVTANGVQPGAWGAMPRIERGKNNMKMTASLLTISCIMLPFMGRIAFGACFDVKTYGATGNGVTDDTASIQAAINAAAAVPRPVVCFPAGTYRVTQAIRPDMVDYLTLQGVAGATIVADPDMSNPIDFTYPEAILVAKGSTTPAFGITIQSLALQVRAGRPSTSTSAGVIQLDNCANCLVSNVTITYTGSTSAIPGQLDGIATAQGTTGKIQGVVVSGIPKAGIYLAGGTHDLIVDQCEVKNTQGPIDQAGFSISGAQNVTVMRSNSHNNLGPGLLIQVQDATPLTNVVVESSQFNNNGGEGIKLSSGLDGNVPSRVAIVGIQALNNASDGVLVEAGKDVMIDGAEVADSGIGGIRIDNTPIMPNYSPRTTVVQIINPNVYDNGRLVRIQESGIGLNGAQQVTITGGRVYRTDLSRNQIYGIGLYRNSFGTASDQVIIAAVDAITGLQPPPIVTIDEFGSNDLAAAVKDGFYAVSANGPPEGVLSAPVGSQYQDLSSHALYKKVSGWGPTGWALF
jgi:hypothetical protein